MYSSYVDRALPSNDCSRRRCGVSSVTPSRARTPLQSASVTPSSSGSTTSSSCLLGTVWSSEQSQRDSCPSPVPARTREHAAFATLPVFPDAPLRLLYLYTRCTDHMLVLLTFATHQGPASDDRRAQLATGFCPISASPSFTALHSYLSTSPPQALPGASILSPWVHGIRDEVESSRSALERPSAREVRPIAEPIIDSASRPRS